VIRLGRGWAPESNADEFSLYAIRELKILLEKIFSTRKKDFSKNDNKRPEL
jgi:hypothetical protein